MPKLKPEDIKRIRELIEDGKGLFRGESDEYKDLQALFEATVELSENPDAQEEYAAQERKLHEAAWSYFEKRVPEEQNSTRRKHMRVAKYLIEHTAADEEPEPEEAAPEETKPEETKVETVEQPTVQTKQPAQKPQPEPEKKGPDLPQLDSATKYFFRDFRVIRALMEGEELSEMPEMDGDDDMSTEEQRETDTRDLDNLLPYRASMEKMVGMHSDLRSGEYVLNENYRKCMKGALVVCDHLEKAQAGWKVLRDPGDASPEQVREAWNDVLLGESCRYELSYEDADVTLPFFEKMSDPASAEKQIKHFRTVDEITSTERYIAKKDPAFQPRYTPIVDFRRKLSGLEKQLKDARSFFGLFSNDSDEYKEMLEDLQELKKEINKNPKLLGSRNGDVDYKDPQFTEKLQKLKDSAAKYFGAKLAQDKNANRQTRMEAAEEIMQLKGIGESEPEVSMKKEALASIGDEEIANSYRAMATAKLDEPEGVDKLLQETALLRGYFTRSGGTVDERVTVGVGDIQKAVPVETQFKAGRGLLVVADILEKEKAAWDVLRDRKGKPESEIVLAKRDALLGQSVRNLLQKEPDPIKRLELMGGFDLKPEEVTRMKNSMQRKDVEASRQSITAQADKAKQTFSTAPEMN